jgi:hypothetical protein
MYGGKFVDAFADALPFLGDCSVGCVLVLFVNARACSCPESSSARSSRFTSPLKAYAGSHEFDVCGKPTHFTKYSSPLAVFLRSASDSTS